MVYSILNCDDPRLKKVSKLVVSFDNSLKKLAEDMAETLKSGQNAIGLSAPQIGIDKRMFVIDEALFLPPDKGVHFSCYINPIITQKSNEIVLSEEGCLSEPNKYHIYKRYEEIEVRYQDLDCNVLVEKASGLKAICIQHQLDHIVGVLQTMWSC